MFYAHFAESSLNVTGDSALWILYNCLQPFYTVEPRYKEVGYNKTLL